ncbi:aminotransferase class III-fold pyridoxal phosphate-dependent enzyme [Nocardia altamirensis]|uniref:aminotransferase class III-fold pyridoxal phosphate-dependent enzyme n=1 Tax=Nocardia altamirensis TaxID=472158 RepID=UPI00084006B6|nr:aminotransferase class III-fold pyridoxal phosphate-dependent enzyme [Nocardia altamirensis]
MDSYRSYAAHARPELARLLRALDLDITYGAARGDELFPAAPIFAGSRTRGVLDLVGGHGATLFGHNHPALLGVAEDSLRDRVPFAAQASIRGAAARLAQRLSVLAGAATGADYVVTFGSTGADAVEAAIKHAAVARNRRLAAIAEELERTLRLVRRDGVADQLFQQGPVEGQTCAAVLTAAIATVTAIQATDPVFVSLGGAFHGRTVGAGALTDNAGAPADLEVPGPRRIRLASWEPDHVVGALDGERRPYCAVIFDDTGAPQAVLRHVSSVAACFTEPIQGEGGVHEVPAATLSALRALADRHDAALVFDEIQCGMGRTGTFFAAETSGVHADYYLLSKSLGGGLAKISALLVDSRHYVLEFGRHHTSTFAEDDFSAAIAAKALDLLAIEQPRIVAAGERLRLRLDAFAARWPDVVAEVRGRGLLLGLELRLPEPTSSLLRAIVAQHLWGYLIAGYFLHEHGIRIMPTLSAPTTLRLQPSAYLSAAEVDRIICAFDATAAVIRRGDYARLLAHLARPAATTWIPPQHVPRLRDSAEQRNAAPNRIAFLANLDTASTLRTLAPELASWSDTQCTALFDRVRGVLEPFEITRETVESPTGASVEVSMIAVPVSAAQIVADQRAGQGRWARRLVLDAVDHAVADGASVIGLGGYTSIVTDGSRDVVEDGARVTSGNSLTAACAYEVLRAELAELPAGARTIGVVGALGNIGAVMAELLAPHCDSIVLVGRPGSASRLSRVAARLVDTEVMVREDMTALRNCRVIVTATNAAAPVIEPGHLASDRSVLVCDLAVPGDVGTEVAARPNVTVLGGGRIRLPLGQTPDFPGTGLEPGVLYACMAETILLGFEPETASPSYGALTVAGVRAARELAARHDLLPVRQPRSGPIAMPQTSPSLLGAADFPIEAAGGKARTLHELQAAGFPVPPGFVLAPDIDLGELSDAELRDWIDRLGGFPVAVRSSGVLEDLDDASFAGLYQTYLDVGDVDTLRRRIVDCRHSAESDRVRAYLARAGFDPSAARVAVLVQRLIPARTAGVAFTIDPLSGIEDNAVLECCCGLGERLVSGHVTPTTVRLRLRDGEVLDRIDGDEDVECSDAEIAELARLMVAVQAYRRRPQDLEWAIDGDGVLWLLQSRAITAVSWRTDIEQFTDADFRDGGVAATVCTPLMFSLYDNAFQHSMQRFLVGLHLLDAADEPDWVAMYYGRPYWNAGAVKRSYTKVPGYHEQHFDLDLGVTKDYGAEGPRRTPITPVTVARAVPIVRALYASYREQLAVVERFTEAWAATYPRWRARVAALPRTDDAEFYPDLVACLRDFHADTERTYFTTIYHNSSVQTDFKGLLDKIEARTGSAIVAIDLMGGLGDIGHMAMQRGILALYDVAVAAGFDGPEWSAALAEFLAEHGFHADAELELTCPRWSEQPERVRSMIESMIAAGTPPADPDRALAEQRAKFDAALATLRRAVRSDLPARVRFSRALERHVERARRYLIARERMRDHSARCYAIVRAYVVEAGSRLAADGCLAAPDEVFMLSMHELAELARTRSAAPDLAEQLRYRRAMYDGYRDLIPPHELGRGITAVPVARGSDSALTGLGCSPGVVEGTVRVLTSLRDIGQLRTGDILVTQFTDPGWTPALGLVAGVVTEVGGMLSHAAVIGREYGIPAVLNVAGATQVLRSGQRVRVDGGAGTVEVIDQGGAEVAESDSLPGVPDGGALGVLPLENSGAMMSDVTDPVRSGAAAGERDALAMRKRMICIAGGDGSGKTTQVARLAAAFESHGQTVASVTIWDAFLDPSVASKLPFDRPGQIYQYLQLLNPLARTHFLFHAMQLALDLAAARGPDVLLVNAYWYKYYATEVAYGGDPAVLRALASGFPEPDLTFHLGISPQDALSRKNKRSDYESGYGDQQEFLEFQSRAHEAIGALSTEFGWIELDGTAPADTITADILARLEGDDR